MTGLWVGFEQRDRVQYRLCESDIKAGDLRSSGSSEENTSHSPASACALSLRDIRAHFIERRNAPSFEIGKAALDRPQGRRVREDLRRLLQALVLIDRNNRGSGTAMAGHDDMLTPVRDLIQEFGKVRA